MDLKIEQIGASGDAGFNLDKSKIRLRLVGEVEKNQWAAVDSTGECLLQVPSETKQRGLFVAGAFIRIYRLIKVEGGLLSLTPRSIVSPTMAFECVQSTLHSEEDTATKTTLRNLQTADPGTKVSAIEVKVIKILPKNLKLDVTAAIIKDETGAKGHLSLWKELAGQVETGASYKITNVMVSGC
jgi:hypothetical protein